MRPSPYEDEASTQMSGLRRGSSLSDLETLGIKRRSRHKVRWCCACIGRWCLTNLFGNFDRNVEMLERAWQPGPVSINKGEVLQGAEDQGDVS